MPEVHLSSQQRIGALALSAGIAICAGAFWRLRGGGRISSLAVAVLAGSVGWRIGIGQIQRSRIRRAQALGVSREEAFNYRVPHRPFREVDGGDTSPLEELPLVVWRDHLFPWLEPADIEHLSLVSKGCCGMVRSEPFAKAWYRRWYGVGDHEETSSNWWVRHCVARFLKGATTDGKIVLIDTEGFPVFKDRRSWLQDPGNLALTFINGAEVRWARDSVRGFYRWVEHGKRESASLAGLIENKSHLCKRRRVADCLRIRLGGDRPMWYQNHYWSEQYSVVGSFQEGTVNVGIAVWDEEIFVICEPESFRAIISLPDPEYAIFENCWEVPGGRQVAVELMLRSSRKAVVVWNPSATALDFLYRREQAGSTSVWVHSVALPHRIGRNSLQVFRREIGRPGFRIAGEPHLAPDGRTWEEVIAERPILNGTGLGLPNCL